MHFLRESLRESLRARSRASSRAQPTLAITAVIVGGLLAAPPTVSAQPAPSDLVRPAGCVLDRAGALRPETIRAIQAECDRVREDGHELAVVVMRTAGSRGPAQYALDLFNAWRLGGPDDNDGVLLYAAIQDRAAEITLGDDLDTTANTARSDRVMSEVIVPAFRRGSPDQAMLDGARYAAVNLFRAGPGDFVRPSARSSSQPTEGRSASGGGSTEPPRQPYHTPLRDYPYRHHEPTVWETIKSSFDAPVGWGVLGVIAFLLLVGLRLFLRYRARDCEKCGSPMLRLGEQEDDAHLDHKQRKEEELGSVDYDVWACLSCDHVIEKRYAAIFTRYRTCSSCQARTESSVSRTIRAATYTSSGLAEVTVSCASCGKSSTHTRTIPRMERPESSGGGGGGGYSSGRSSGGGSSGGGSSGRW